MQSRDELDRLAQDYLDRRIDRRTFMRQGLLWGLSLSSLTAFLASCGTAAPAGQGAAVGTAGAPVHINVGYFPSWEGGLSGVIIKKRNLWQKYLPKGSTVNWQVQIVGPPIVADLLANKEQIGYIGDMPAFVATAKREIADLRLVECNEFSPNGEMCCVLLVRSDAPKFKDYQEAVRWLTGKTIGISGKGSCGDRFVTTLMQKEHISARKEYLDPTIILTSLRTGKIDACQTFEPHVAQITSEGVGRVVATGNDFGDQDADFIVMRKDFIDQHRDAAVGWIKADIEALQFILGHPYETVKYLAAELPGYTTRQLWTAIYGRLPSSSGAGTVRTVAQAVFSKEVTDFIDKSFQFLYQDKILTIDKPLPGAVYTALVDQAVKELGVTAPLGAIRGEPVSSFNPAKA
ncbi:MAG: ABC transporter substrate-binding protein [Thermaerobacter sp.]|nr:ABC transporter substrate-binding protein [Thermaerobacter sp.]